MARAKARKGSQLTQVQQPEVAEPFKKAVQAIHVSPVGGSLTLQQRRLFNALIKNAIEHRLGEARTVETFQISIPEMMANLALTTKDTSYIKETAKSLMRTVVDWDQLNSDGTATWTGSTLLAGARITGSQLSYSFAPQIREELLNPERYAMIDMRIAKLFRRAHSLAIWENTVRYERAGITARIPLAVFRNLILGREESETKYKEYKIFKRAVLNPCIAEICNVSDHYLELIEHKVGRSVTELQFRITRKEDASSGEADGGEAGDQANVGDLIPAIIGLGLPASEARKLATMHPHGALHEAIAHIRTRESATDAPAIDNVPAYLRKILGDMAGQGVGDGGGGRDGRTANAGKGRAGGTRPATGATMGATEEPAAPPPPPAKSAKEAMERYIAARLPRAQAYFVSLADEEQMPLISRYNAQCATAELQLVTRKRPTKVAQTSFYQWLADQTWGIPTADDVLSFVLTGNVAA